MVHSPLILYLDRRESKEGDSEGQRGFSALRKDRIYNSSAEWNGLIGQLPKGIV